MEQPLGDKSSGMTVLFISDGETVLADAMTSLVERDFGFTVVGRATTLRGALDLIKESSPDLVMCGTGFPEVSPEGLATAIEAEMGRKVPVLVLTRSDDPSALVDALRGPVAGYLFMSGTSSQQLLTAMKAATQGLVILGPGVREKLANSLIDWASTSGRSVPSAPLTGREQKVLEGLMQGLTNREIARRLSISVRTVQIHVTNLRLKLDARSRTELVVRGLQLAKALSSPASP